MKKIIFSLIVITYFLSTAFAASFVVHKIEFRGLKRMSEKSAETYLPIKRGQTLTDDKSAKIVRALYKTGFFDQIRLAKSGSTLIISVTERPTIGQLKISGNSVVPTDKLTTVMKSLDIAEGHIYNQAVLERIRKSLLGQYYQLGRYNARVDITTTPMTRNRVMVKITISEGLVAKVKRISILGNHAFDESTLIKQLDLTTTGLFTFISQSDRYSEEKLETSLEKLRAYYLDHGYIRFEIKSSQAEVTPDRKAVYVTIVIEEGPVYTIKDFKLSGHLILPREEIIKHIHIKPGDVFSRQKIMDSEKEITKQLGDKGYIFSSISLRPQVSDQNRQLILVFEIKPGKRVYVRRVGFSDNTRTNDVVLRREVLQMESAPASSSLLEQSKHRLLLLPYIKEAEMSVNPVAGQDDQVDVNYKVKEENAAQATFRVGYSQVYRTIIGAGINHKNFLGTGNTLGLNFQRSKFEQIYSIDYTDPYYTPDGISRSFNFAISQVDPGAASNLNNGYTINQYEMGVLYGIPIGQEQNVFNRIQTGVNYQNVLVNLNTSNPDTISNQVNTFIDRHGRRFQELDFRLGYSRDGRDKAIFPTNGALQTVFLDFYAPVTHESVTFYTVNYHGVWYRPLTEQFIFLSRANLGYGSGWHGAKDFPFFRNFYSGGIDSVRGYQGYTLGPRDSNNKSFGGNMLADASIGMIFPNYLSDNLRTSAYFDAGNVYSIGSNRSYGGQSTDPGPIRYSAGVEADWITPFGPIKLSLAKALNRRPHDELEAFQFSLGANF
jgi:outer membrane protein insertion porin family